MPQIIPIKELKNTAHISALCNETIEPIFITKNGYGDMVIMSIKTYEEKLLMQDIYMKLEDSEKDIQNGNTLDARESLANIRTKFNV